MQETFYPHPSSCEFSYPRPVGDPRTHAQAPGSTAVRGWLPLLAFAALHLTTAIFFVFGRAPGTDAALTGVPLDDAWIHLVYARNLAWGHGFAYNPGELEAGFTSPLWAVLLVPAVWAEAATGVSVIFWAKVIGTGVGIAASALAFRLCLRLGVGRAAAWLAGGLIAVDPSLAFAQVSGMEVVLAAAAVLLALERLAAPGIRGAGIALALAPLARPENALITTLGMAALAFVLLRERAPWWRWMAVLAPIAAAAAAWTGYCLLVTGRLLPNTFYVKARAGRGGWLANFRQLLDGMVMELPWMAFGAGLVLALVGAWVLVGGALRRRRDGTPDETATLGVRCARGLLVLAVPVFLAGVGFVHALVQTQPYYWNRYFQPVIALLLVLIAVGAVELWRALRSRRQGGNVGADAVVSIPRPGWGPVRRSGGTVLALAVYAMASYRVPERLKDDAILFAWNCQNINELNVKVGHWLAANAGPDDWIATHDAGAIRYWSGRRVLDFVGLNSHRVLREGATAEVLRVRPRFFAAFPKVFPALAKNPSLEVVFRAHAHVLTICDCPQDELVVLRPRDGAR